ncbi:hypothetical protein [Actinomadura chokoriensis]|uniref:Uncharacterized protein n=1 Tax=Actinomadura chokoriensis TaxID=454156 RepID=A0ABV4QU40_9ACTN
MTCYERLDDLRERIRRQAPDVAVFLTPGEQILHVRRRAEPGAHIRWDHGAAAYLWVDGPDAGAQVGADAARAAERLTRTLTPRLRTSLRASGAAVPTEEARRRCT